MCARSANRTRFHVAAGAASVIAAFGSSLGLLKRNERIEEYS